MRKWFAILIASALLLAQPGRAQWILTPILVGGTSVAPAWVATACPLGTPSYCVDFTNNRAWDGVSHNVKTATADLSLTRAYTETYIDASNNISQVSSGAPAIGSNGLQVMGGINLIGYSTPGQSGNTFNTGWTANGSTTAPTVTYVANGGPSGVYDDSKIVFAAASGSGQYSDISWNMSGLTAGGVYTCWAEIKGNAGGEQIMMFTQETSGANAGLAGKILSNNSNSNGLTTTWAPQSVTFTAGTTGVALHIGMRTDTTVLSILNNGASGSFPNLTGGTVHVSMVACAPGFQISSFVPTTGTAVTAAQVDNVSATGDLATAFSQAKTISITTTNGRQGEAATFIGNANSVGGSSAIFLGKTTGDALVSGASSSTTATSTWTKPETSTISWSSGTNAYIDINGSCGTSVAGTCGSSDAATRSLASGTVYLGSSAGSTTGLCNCNFQTLAIYGAQQTLVATSSQPVTSIAFQNSNSALYGLLDYQGNTNLGGPYYYTANYMTNYNLQKGSSHLINADTMTWTWGADGNSYGTTGDTPGQFNGSGDSGGASNNASMIYLPTPSWQNPFATGINSTSFAATLGTETQFVGCTYGTLGTQNCEWKPTSIISLAASVTGNSQDIMLFAISRQWETSGYGQIYSSIAYATNTYSSGYATPWKSVTWSGLPGTQAGDLSTPTFGYTALGNSNALATITFVQFGKNYANVSGNPDSQNTYLYAILSNYSGQVTNTAICVRIALSNLTTASNAAAVDGSNYPKYWQYYKGGGNWSSASSDWSSWSTNAQNIWPTGMSNVGGGPFSIQYLPAQNRYIMSSWYGASAYWNTMQFAEAPHPWGPWTLIQSVNSNGPGLNFPSFQPDMFNGASNGRTGAITASGNPSYATSSLYSLWSGLVQVNN